MHSIRAKFTLLTIAAIVISSLLIGAISLAAMRAETEHRSEQLMNLICEAKCDELNNYLSGIEESVGTASRYVYESLDVVQLARGDVIGATGSGRSLNKRERTPEQQSALDDYLNGFLTEADSVCSTIADNNASVLGYYFRINPEVSSSVRGFWYSRHNTTNFERMELTDVSDYRVDDVSHVGWYYVPLERGRPSWVDPHENANLGLQVISYIAPVYKADTFIGVIGIDILYSTLVDRVSELQILDTGYAFLIDENGKIVYHPTLLNGVLLSDVNTELETAKTDEDSDQLATYTYEGVHKKAAWDTLSNGLRLIVAAPDSEINASWYSLSLVLLIAATVILFVFITISTLLTRQITKPLARLAQASKQLSAGNYDVELSYEGDDEVGLLTKSFKQMASHLQAFIYDLNSKAYRDALTGVRNKGAFDILVRNMDETMKGEESKGELRFAVGMFDCNDLKPINDTYGHEKGDIYLQTACRLICQVFAHSPVFRIGGDEFVAVLQESDLEHRAELEQRFRDLSDEINANAGNAWEKTSVAIGIAEYDPALDHNVESVLRRADEIMYANKEFMKRGGVL